MAEKISLTPAQQRALAAWLTTGDLAQAARAGDCSQRTLARWRNLPAWVTAETEAQAELFAGALAVLATLQRGALATLAGLLRSESEGVRARAAIALLDLAERRRSTEDFERRIAALERGHNVTHTQIDET